MSWGKVRPSVNPSTPIPNTSSVPEHFLRGAARRFGWVVLVLISSLLLRLPPPGPHPSTDPVLGGLLSLDGYYYARLAAGSSRQVSLRDILSPPPPDRPHSALPALARLLPAPYARTWLPPLAGAAATALLLFLAFHLHPTVPKPLLASAVLAGASGPYFAARSAAGWFDTDGILVLSMTLLAASALMDRSRHARLAAATLATGVLLLAWGWDQAPDVVLMLCAFHLVLFAGNAPGVRRSALITAGILAGALVLLLGPAAVFSAPLRWLGRLDYLSGNTTLPYPNPAGLVEEQISGAWSEAFLAAHGGWPVAVVVALGGAALVRKRGVASATLLPCLLLGWGATLTAPRFAVFAAPLGAVALASLAGFFYARRPGLRALPWLAGIAFTCALVWQGWITRRLLATSVTPLETSISAALAAHGPAATASTRPIAWAWWDEGYEIQHRLGWRTLVDGGHHDGEHMVVAATPLAMTRQDAAARYIRHVARGGLAAARALEPARGSAADGALAIQERSLTLPSSATAVGDAPVYLVLTARTAMAFPHLLYCGGWTPSLRSGVRSYYEYLPAVTGAGGILRASNGMEIEVAGWRPEAAGKFIVLPSPAMDRPPAGYPATTGRLETDLARGHGALGAPRALDTVFHQLFVRRQPDPACFRPLPGATTGVVIYEVLPPGDP
jgi:hypothetical protein